MNSSGYCCVFPGCSTTPNANISVSLFRFPSDAAVNQKWVDLIRSDPGNLGWKPKSSDRLCSLHFDPCMISRGANTRLLKSAVPAVEFVTTLENAESEKIVSVEHESIHSPISGETESGQVQCPNCYHCFDPPSQPSLEPQPLFSPPLQSLASEANRTYSTKEL